MMFSKVNIVTALLLCFLCGFVSANAPASRSSRRIHLPWFGIGPDCDGGCPPNFCDDDPAIVHGYCCGCARFYDVLPVRCSDFLKCPLNTFELCDSYEYMMHCCCS